MIIYPENSLIAFENAVNYTNFIELDIHFSKDNIPVVIHDDTLDRVTNCKGKVKEKMWQDIKRCKLKNRLDWGISSYKISSFYDVLASKKLRKVNFIVEIKDFNIKAINKLMSIIKNKKNIIIQSFNLNILKYIHDNFHYKKLFLIKNTPPNSLPEYISGLITNYKNIKKIKKYSRQIIIYVYTVDKINDFKNLLKERKVDGIMTNDVRFFSFYIKKKLFLKGY